MAGLVQLKKQNTSYRTDTLNRKMGTEFILLYLLTYITITTSFVCEERSVYGPVKERICQKDYSQINEYAEYEETERCDMEYPVVEKNITCSDLGELFKGYEIAEYPTRLKIIHTNNPVLAPSIFVHKEKVFALYLENLGIHTLMPGTFNFLHNLKELYLDENKLTELSSGIFNSLALLDKLDISSNQIQNIADHAFTGTNLNSLSLSNNNISEIAQVMIDSLKYLETLNISYNEIHEINDFSNLSLRTLDISHNILDVVDFELLQNVRVEVDLSFNNISDLINFNVSVASTLILRHNRIQKLEKNEHVLYLDVTSNRLEKIGSNMFGSQLRGIGLGKNSISTMNTDAFFGLKDLRYLLLGNNNLSSIPSSCFKDLNSLVVLDLSGNELSHFKYGTFDSLVNLEILTISNNHFKSLPENVFHALQNLTVFHFENNEISNIDVDNLLVHAKNLQKVTLSGNAWDCKGLVHIVESLKNKGIVFPSGKFREESNVHGIKCYEQFGLAEGKVKSDGNLEKSKTNYVSTDDFTKTTMYRYFNDDFKDSGFFKYLESLKNTMNNTYTQNMDTKYLQAILEQIKLKSNSSDNDEFIKNVLDNYLNNFQNFTDDFKNFTSDFKKGLFGYLESFKNQAVETKRYDNLIVNKLDGLTNVLKNYTANISGKNNVYNYFDKDFKDTNFFKYLENLKISVNEKKLSENLNNSKTEKLTNTRKDENVFRGPNYIGLLSFIAILLVIIICALIGTTYVKVLLIKKGNSKKDDVELI